MPFPKTGMVRKLYLGEENCIWGKAAVVFFAHIENMNPGPEAIVLAAFVTSFCWFAGTTDVEKPRPLTFDGEKTL